MKNHQHWRGVVRCGVCVRAHEKIPSITLSHSHAGNRRRRKQEKMAEMEIHTNCCCGKSLRVSGCCLRSLIRISAASAIAAADAGFFSNLLSFSNASFPFA